MNYESRFPALMKSSQYLSFFAFLCTFPLSAVADLYFSFGQFNAHADYITFKLGLLFLVTAVSGLNLVVNTSHWLRLFSFGCYLIILLSVALVVVIFWDMEGYIGDELTTAGNRYSPILFFYLAYALLGLSFSFFESFRWVLLLCLLLVSGVVLQYVDYSAYSIDTNNFVEGADRGNYQFIGDAFAITALLVIAYFRNGLVRSIVFVGALVILFLIGSRTAFAVFGLTGLVFLVIASLRVTLVFAAVTVLTLVLCAVALGLFSSSVDVDDLEQRNSRMIGIFTDYNADSSIVARRDINEVGWEDISVSPIFGKFGGQRKIDGWNSYMHNFFSYWRQFGIVPFVLLLALYALFFALCLKMRKYNDNHFFTVPLLVGTFIVIESVISRSFVFASTHLFFGLLISFHAWNRYGSSFLYARGGIRRHRRRRRRSSAGAGAVRGA